MPHYKKWALCTHVGFVFFFTGNVQENSKYLFIYLQMEWMINSEMPPHGILQPE